MTDPDRQHGDEPVPDPAVDTVEGGPEPSDDDADGAPTGASAGDREAPAAASEGDAGAAHEAGFEVTAEEDPRSREELLAELLEAEARRDEYLDDLRRARAEFDNFRRRTMKEGATQRELGRAEVLSALLEVLDDLDRTLEAAESSEDPGLAKGVGLVAGKLVQALQGQGLQRIDETGVPFDPNLHEAVQQNEAEETRDEPTVSQVLRPGYRADERVLRAAMVVVEQ